MNGDKAVNITDVTALIDYVLNGDPTNVVVENAECTNDDLVNIADVTALIDFVLGGAWADGAAERVWLEATG